MTPPRLVLLNGLPGSGKSTLARRLAAERPGTEVVDVDAVRAGLGHPDPVSQDAGLRAREVALGLAREHLLDGDDVLVPQFLGRPAFVEALERLAAEVGAIFVEVVLDADPAEVEPRLAARAVRAERPEHALAADLLAGQAGAAALARCRQQLAELLVLRPNTHVARSTADPDSTYRALVAVLPPPRG